MDIHSRVIKEFEKACLRVDLANTTQRCAPGKNKNTHPIQVQRSIKLFSIVLQKGKVSLSIEVSFFPERWVRLQKKGRFLLILSKKGGAKTKRVLFSSFLFDVPSSCFVIYSRLGRGIPRQFASGERPPRLVEFGAPALGSRQIFLLQTKEGENWIGWDSSRKQHFLSFCSVGYCRWNV